MKLQLSEKQLLQQVRCFAYYQLASGLALSIFIVVLLIQATNLPKVLVFLYTGMLGQASFIFYCGYLIKQDPLRGLHLSRISLLIQFIGFAAGGFSFRLFAGPFIALSLEVTNNTLLKVDASLADISFNINSDPGTLVLSVNIVATLLFIRTTFWLNEWNKRYYQSIP